MKDIHPLVEIVGLFFRSPRRFLPSDLRDAVGPTAGRLALPRRLPRRLHALSPCGGGGASTTYVLRPPTFMRALSGLQPYGTMNAHTHCTWALSLSLPPLPRQLPLLPHGGNRAERQPCRRAPCDMPVTRTRMRGRARGRAGTHHMSITMHQRVGSSAERCLHGPYGEQCAGGWRG